jgi:hypothetical protein
MVGGSPLGTRHVGALADRLRPAQNWSAKLPKADMESGACSITCHSADPASLTAITPLRNHTFLISYYSGLR